MTTKALELSQLLTHGLKYQINNQYHRHHVSTITNVYNHNKSKESREERREIKRDHKREEENEREEQV